MKKTLNGIDRCSDIPEDVNMTVVALCRGYSRRKRYLDALKSSPSRGAAPLGSRTVKAYSEFLNGIIDDAIADCCDGWNADDIRECIADQVGFRRYKNNHLMPRDAFYEQKKAVVKAIAERLGLM